MFIPLRNPSLLPKHDETRPSLEVYDPADSESVVGIVTRMDVNDARTMIDKSITVLPSWRDGTTAVERSKLLSEWSRLIHENVEDIATIMTRECGKPIKESIGEVAYARSFLDYYAGEALRPSSAGGGFLVPTPFSQPDGSGKPRGQIMAIHQAVGVTASITPWNFPIAMITRKVGPALAAGCTAIVKPAELTPLTAVALQALAVQAGIPNDVFQVITCDRDSTPDVGKEFCMSPLVHKISFTGSTNVGKKLMEQSSSTVKRISLELGGNAPFVVFEDADVDQAVAAAVSSKFRNAGQTCVCSDRFLVHSSIHDQFVDKLVQKVKAMKIGPGIDESTTIGPLITQVACTEVHQKVQEAVAEGAKCVVGGKAYEGLGSNHFYEPTVLCDVSTDSRIWKTETFGPVAPIRTFETEDEALSIANDSRVGLAGYFCTKDIGKAFRFANALQCGLVGVNEGVISSAYAPFGGVKESGIGREGSPLGIAEYLETKYVFMNY